MEQELTLIDEDHQAKIIQEIREQTEHLKGKNKEKSQTLLLIGVIIGLQVLYKIPPHWLINIQCGRADRIFNK